MQGFEKKDFNITKQLQKAPGAWRHKEILNSFIFSQNKDSQ